MEDQELTPDRAESPDTGEQTTAADTEAAIAAEAEAEATALAAAAREAGVVEDEEPAPEPVELPDTELKAILEAVVYVTEEPLEAKQMAQALGQKQDRVEAMLAELVNEYAQSGRGLQIREIAGGYKMSTKPEHHEAVRQFVKNLKAPLKLTNAALETLAVIAYKQPITAPEIMEIRGVQGAGVLKTLLDRKLITTAGRKNVIGKPILYKTTKDFLLQFGLKSLNELPTLKEFEELRRLAFTEDEVIEDSEGPSTAAEAQAAELPAAESEAPAAESPAQVPQPEPELAQAAAAPAGEDAAPSPAPDTAPEA
jgi:segregation and condensation protein B